MQVESSQPRLPGFEDPDSGNEAGTESMVPSGVLFETPEQLCARVFRTIRPRTPAPVVAIEFCGFANANSFIRMEAGRLHLRISDVLQTAPSPILEALFHILICKLFRRPVPDDYRQRYRLYLNRQDVRGDLHRTRRERGRKYASGPKGLCYDLDEIFDQMNREHFGGAMTKPRLGWSRQISRTVLGHFDPSHNAIILSRLLDGPTVPKLAVEYVMYHEMLHLQHPVGSNGARRIVHSKEFRADEKKFPKLKEAKLLLEKLCKAAAHSGRW